LSGAKSTTEKQLEQAKSLEGATMPNGMLYADYLNWLKDIENRNQPLR
jgi:hypothetical protein